MLTPLLSHFVPKDILERRKKHGAYSREQALNRQQDNTDRLDLISGFLKPEAKISQMEYESTVRTLIVAGSETTATLLSGVTYLLLTNPEKMEKVVKEIRSSFSSEEEITFVSVNKLDYLLACLNEALRMYPPTPDAFPRRTGQGPEIICGKLVPPDVSTQPFL